jgi:probable rRNA maturation factor
VRTVAAIGVTSACVGWERICPHATRLARHTAQVALAHGISSRGIAFPERVELSITLTDDSRQRQLNRRYRGQNKSTNVLAFAAWEPVAALPSGAPLLLGDVVLAFETVARETVEQGKKFPDHFRHLVVHGVLHLLGCDHCSEGDAADMEALETSILAELGVPDPYR